MRIEIIEGDVGGLETIGHTACRCDWLWNVRDENANDMLVPVELWFKPAWMLGICCRIPSGMIRLCVLAANHRHVMEISPRFRQDAEFPLLVFINVVGMAATIKSFDRLECGILRAIAPIHLGRALNALKRYGHGSFRKS